MAEKSKGSKQLLWYNILFIGFAGVWGFGNVVNNYSEQGLEVIFSWIFLMILYFLPYALIVGELGSAYSSSRAGVSSWIKNTAGTRLAYFAAWTYWVVHIPYIAQKPQRGVIGIIWGITLDPTLIDKFSTVFLQLIYITIFVLFVVLAFYGIKSLKLLGTVAGLLMFIMSMLYILLGISAILFLDIDFATANITLSSFIPTFNFQYLTTLSLLVFAVGGIEKMSPYISETKDGASSFPKAMFGIFIMVVISAIFGSIAMGAMFDSNNIPTDLMQNGEYYAFNQLGEWYFGAGTFMSTIFTRIYGFTNAAAQFTALLIAIDAPLKMLLMESDDKYIPKVLTKENKNNAPYVAYCFMAALVIIILILPMFSNGSSSEVYEWLMKLNSVVMPLRYLWVFVAYILFKKALSRGDVTKPEYQFTKSNTVGIVIAAWCFFYTSVACLFGMIPDAGILGAPVEFLVNILTPLILVGLGFIMPFIAKKTN